MDYGLWTIDKTMQAINTLPAGYHFPAEWAKHTATWLSWPHKEASWPGKIDSIYPIYAQFIKAVAEGEQVYINVNDEQMKVFATSQLEKQGVDLSKVSFLYTQLTMHGVATMVRHF